ncbi:MAG: hypothetical protein NC124_16650 [Clostridium sp.]|nr:hypothetical protein [Clostridium sp.]
MENTDAFHGFHLCEIIDCKLNHDWDKALNYFAAIAVLPEATEVKISKKLLPNLLAEPYLVYSFQQLGIGVCLCD